MTKKAFQSTLPRGSDPCYAGRLGQYANFNPRSLAGATFKIPDYYLKLFISIHAPSRERQPTKSHKKSPRLISIHAPSRERPNMVILLCYLITFQSTLPRGSDLSEPDLSYVPVHFNPRSLAGATIIPGVPNIGIGHFNPRSLAGATVSLSNLSSSATISIHAPSRERPA